MVEAGGSEDRIILPWSLRMETTRLKTLIRECRMEGVANEGLAQSLRGVRTLVEAGRYDEAFDRMRELRLKLLARMLLEESRRLPAARVENVVPSPLPSEAVLTAISPSPDRESASSTRSRPSP